MKYNININQKSVIDNGFDLDIIDCAILDFIVDFSHSGNCEKILLDGRFFYWISYQLICDQLPILKMKKDSVYRRIKSLCESGFLEADANNQSNGRTFFAIGSKCVALRFTGDAGLKSERPEINPSDVGLKSVKVSDGDPNYNDINNNSNKENELFSSSENDPKVASKQKCPIYQDAVKIYFNFYRTKNGHNPKIDAADGKALKQLIAYFKQLAKDSPNQKDEVLKMFHLVFRNWNLVDPFHQKNIKLTQINSQINNIINSIKNGKSKPNPSASGTNGNKIVGTSNPFTIDDFVGNSGDR